MLAIFTLTCWLSVPAESVDSGGSTSPGDKGSPGTITKRQIMPGGCRGQLSVWKKLKCPVVSIWSLYLVSNPFGLISAFSVALWSVMPVTHSLSIVGGEALAALVSALKHVKITTIAAARVEALAYSGTPPRVDYSAASSLWNESVSVKNLSGSYMDFSNCEVRLGMRTPASRPSIPLEGNPQRR
jgi:hypothetical protein